MNIASEITKYESIIFEHLSQRTNCNDDPSHDLNHIKRVVDWAKKLAKSESANLAIIVPAAYLHDYINISKNDPRRSMASQISADEAIKFLEQIGYPSQYFNEIHHAIVAHSYSAQIKAETLEAKIVQDSDRLDGIGAIGIARCFAISGMLKRPFYSESDPFHNQRPLDDKKYTLDHFYVKLLLVSRSLNTQMAIAEGAKRTEFLRAYLENLRQEIQ